MIEPEVERIEFHKKRAHVRQLVDGYIRLNGEWDKEICSEINGKMIRLMVDYFSHEVHGEIATLSVSYPATWWEHLKKRLGWKWIGNIRYKTEQKTYQFTIEAFYPELVLPDQPVAYVHKLKSIP